MLKSTAKRIINLIPHYFEPFLRNPDFGGDFGWYIQARNENRIFLIKGKGEPMLKLVEIGLGTSGIGWNDIAKNCTALKIINKLEEIKAE